MSPSLLVMSLPHALLGVLSALNAAIRPTLGAGVIANDAEGLRRWLSDHQSIKHGIAMPRHDDIPEETLGQLADWLETLAP